MSSVTAATSTDAAEDEKVPLKSEEENAVVYTAREFNYSFAYSDDQPQEQEVKPFQNVKYSKDELDVKDVNKLSLALLACCCCCCSLSIVVLVVGAFLLAYNDYKDKQGIEIAGAALLAFGAILFFIGFIVCCVSCCHACTKNLDKKSSSKWKLKRLNDEFSDEVQSFKSLRYRVGGGVKTFQEKKKTEKLKKVEEKKKKSNTIESLIKEDVNAGLSTKEIQNKRRPVVFKVDFDGDIHVSTIDVLRDQITLCLTAGCKHDIVCVVVTSGGGSVTMYGLAAAQLARVRKAGLRLIVCVDSIAASGGYLMATMGNEILASPFALVGSIGVISIVPNVQKLLEKYNINTHVFTAGKYKRTVDIVGDVTDEGKAKMVEELESIHQIFKDHIVANRPALKETIDEVATGEAWLSIEAKPKGLVDEILTSDEYLMKMSKTHDIIAVELKPKKNHIWDDLTSLKTTAVLGKLFNNLFTANTTASATAAPTTERPDLMLV